YGSDSEDEEPFQHKKDTWDEFDRDQLLASSKRGDKNKRRPMEKLAASETGGHRLDATGIFIHRFKEANKISDPVLRAIACAFLMSPISKHQVYAMIDSGQSFFSSLDLTDSARCSCAH